MRHPAQLALRRAAFAALSMSAILSGPEHMCAAADQPVFCPLTSSTYSAEVEHRSDPVRSGVPFAIRVRLIPPEPPPGFFVTINVDSVSAPPAGRVDSLPGFPDTDVTCSAPGHYRLNLRVALVAKSSCGGVKAATLLDREVDIIAR